MHPCCRWADSFVFAPAILVFRQLPPRPSRGQGPRFSAGAEPLNSPAHGLDIIAPHVLSSHPHRSPASHGCLRRRRVPSPRLGRSSATFLPKSTLCLLGLLASALAETYFHPKTEKRQQHRPTLQTQLSLASPLRSTTTAATTTVLATSTSITIITTTTTTAVTKDRRPYGSCRRPRLARMRAVRPAWPMPADLVAQSGNPAGMRMLPGMCFGIWAFRAITSSWCWSLLH